MWLFSLALKWKWGKKCQWADLALSPTWHIVQGTKWCQSCCYEVLLESCPIFKLGLVSWYYIHKNYERTGYGNSNTHVSRTHNTSLLCLSLDCRFPTERDVLIGSLGRNKGAHLSGENRDMLLADESTRKSCFQVKNICEQNLKPMAIIITKQWYPKTR